MRLIINFFTPKKYANEKSANVVHPEEVRIDYVWRGLPEIMYFDWTGEKRWAFDRNGQVGFAINLDNVHAFHENRRMNNEQGEKDLERISEWNRFKNIMKKAKSVEITVNRDTPLDVSDWNATLYFSEGIDGVPVNQFPIKVAKEV